MESGVWQERPGWGGKVLSDEMGVGWIHQAVLCKEGRGGDSGDGDALRLGSECGVLGALSLQCGVGVAAGFPWLLLQNPG